MSPRTRSGHKVAELGAQLSADYAGRPLTLVSVLKGSLPFMADLMRAITIPLTIDLMEVSSYGGAVTETSGLVRILKDLSATIEGKDVVIVEDIIDTGLTLNYLLRYLRGKNPRSLQASAPCWTSRRAAWWTSTSTTAASPSPTASSSATGWTTASSTATCRSSACSARGLQRAVRRGLGAGRLLVGIGSRCWPSSARSCPGRSRAARSGMPVRPRRPSTAVPAS